ncbi:unnamed protein product, partial [Iphiclides podalirius]
MLPFLVRTYFRWARDAASRAMPNSWRFSRVRRSLTKSLRSSPGMLMSAETGLDTPARRRWCERSPPAPRMQRPGPPTLCLALQL